MISTVAVGTDGSGTAAEAVEAAAEMARRFDAELVLMSAFRDATAPGRDAAETDWAVSPAARTREVLARAEEELQARGLRCRTVIDEGDPADVLVRLAAEVGADVIVIGNRGMRRRVLGSVPKEVVQKADCAVYVVKTT